VGTNDTRKNVTTLTKVFAKAMEGTKHLLIVKTNKDDGLTRSTNIKINDGQDFFGKIGSTLQCV